MKRLIIVLGGLAVLVYAASAGMQWLTPRVEEDLANRVNVSLAEQGLLWADVNVDGRNVTLSGVAPSADSRDKALGAAARVFGVASVTDGLLLADDLSGTKVIATSTSNAAAKDAYSVTLTKQGDDITMAGTVPDEQSLEVLSRLAETHYGADHVSNSLTVKAADAPAGWRSATGTVLFSITNLEEAQVTLSGREIMISGTVLDKQFADQLETQLGTTLPENYKLALAVDVVTPSMLVSETPAEEPAKEQADDAKMEEKKAEAAAKDEKAKDIEPAAGPAATTPTAAAKVSDVKPAEVAKAKVEDVTPTATPEEPSASGILAKVESFMNGTKDKVQEAMELPDTVTGKEQTNKDCNATELAMHKVYFDFDRTQVKDVYKPTIEKVAAEVPSCAAVEVSGFTDSTGSALYNQWLSEQRAEAGVRALIRAGAPADKLVAKGYGLNMPVATNGTKQGRSQNRRVEFKPTDAANVSASVVTTPVKAAAPKAEAKAKKAEVKAPEKDDEKVVIPATVPSMTMTSSGSVVEVVSTGTAPWWERFKAAPVSATMVTKSDVTVTTK